MHTRAPGGPDSTCDPRRLDQEVVAQLAGGVMRRRAWFKGG
jgi:hypothetical protein